jgi:hypothetical protein
MAELEAVAAQVSDAFADRVCLMTGRDLDPIELHNTG